MNAWEIKRAAQIPIWQERIKACRSSGMTVKAWCKENGFTKQTYYAWEKLCLQRAHNENVPTSAIIKVVPDELPSGEATPKVQPYTAPAELVLHCGCVSIDINSGVPVTRIAELVAALNGHV